MRITDDRRVFIVTVIAVHVAIVIGWFCGLGPVT